jgi:gluconokinase
MEAVDRASASALERLPPRPPPAVVVLMGVSGSGKTTIGTLLAGRLQWEFEDGDGFHPAVNIEKMRAGNPLTDEDRWPWLRAIAEWIDAMRQDGSHGVVTCSALKRRYRALIVGDRPDVRLVYLKGDRTVIARRQAAREGHFMPPALLDSQFQALEEPGPAEDPITVSIDPRPRDIVEQIRARLEAQSTALASEPSAPDKAL